MQGTEHLQQEAEITKGFESEDKQKKLRRNKPKKRQKQRRSFLQCRKAKQSKSRKEKA